MIHQQKIQLANQKLIILHQLSSNKQIILLCLAIKTALFFEKKKNELTSEGAPNWCSLQY